VVDMTDPQPPDPQPTDIHIQADQRMRGGIWANFAIVSHSPHEFTLDFARLDYNTRPIQGVIVQRVNMSPLFVEQLINALAANLDDYAKTMPDGMIAEEDQ